MAIDATAREAVRMTLAAITSFKADPRSCDRAKSPCELYADISMRVIMPVSGLCRDVVPMLQTCPQISTTGAA